MRAEDITAVVLCGGSAARLGGVDKPMLRMDGRPLVEYIIEALRPQVGGVIIGGSRDPEAYAALGYPVVADDQPGEGPIGGIVSAFATVETEWVLTHPGDAPFPDPRLVARLTPTAEEGGVAVPRAGDYRQNLVLLVSRAKTESLARFYEDGGRAVKDWLDAEQVRSVDMSDVADSFFNVNTEADLATIARSRG